MIKKLSALSILIIILVLLCLNINTGLFGDENLYYAIYNFLHIAAFAIITFAFYKLIPELKYKTWLIIGIAVSLAFLTELIQMYNARDADIADLFKNIVGISITISWKNRNNTSTRFIKSSKKYIFLCVIAITIILFLNEVGSYFYYKLKFKRKLPILAKFENNWELKRWQTNNSEIELSDYFASDGKLSLKINFGISLYSGISIKNFISDWRGYSYFYFDVFNPQKETVNLYLRFDDKESTDYNSRGNLCHKIKSGINKIKIPIEAIKINPKKRSLDLRFMKSIVFFLHKPEKEITLFIDHVGFQK